jgi:hypothetical protein
MPLGIPRGARCVQRFDDSRNSAIHITYRISLRSSSMREPRDPLLKVVFMITLLQIIHKMHPRAPFKMCEMREYIGQQPQLWSGGGIALQDVHKGCDGNRELFRRVHIASRERPATSPNHFSNDPSAGSPTETLLRLLLPLNDQV